MIYAVDTRNDFIRLKLVAARSITEAFKDQHPLVERAKKVKRDCVTVVQDIVHGHEHLIREHQGE